ncbi:DUF4867 family protein [Alicyclobacillus sp. SO9]|nr:DUF4867 family protein [Alicyclobacillus sp. SO9]
MERFERLKSSNPDLSLRHVHESSFATYGRVLKDYDVSQLRVLMERTTIPEFGNRYEASIHELEETHLKGLLESSVYGGLEIQIGYCNGMNSFLNGLEYHKVSEVNVAITDFILLLGKVQDIRCNTYSVEQVEAFYVPQDTALELYGTTLHYAPCKVSSSGFKCVVVLPKGVNFPLQYGPREFTLEDKLLFMRSKWLLVHPSRQKLIQEGACAGIKGENLEVVGVADD